MKKFLANPGVKYLLTFGIVALEGAAEPVSEALELSNKAVIEALDGLPAQKIHCSVLAEEAVKAAVKDYYDKNGIAYDADLFSTHDCAACHGG